MHGLVFIYPYIICICFVYHIMILFCWEMQTVNNIIHISCVQTESLYAIRYTSSHIENRLEFITTGLILDTNLHPE